MHTFYKTESSVSGLPENKPIGSLAGTKKITLLKKGDKVFALAALCPHAGAPMCDGWVDALGRIVCPVHKYRFDPANGRNTSGEGYKLFIYPVELKGDEIFVGVLEQ